MQNLFLVDTRATPTFNDNLSIHDNGIHRAAVLAENELAHYVIERRERRRVAV